MNEIKIKWIVSYCKKEIKKASIYIIIIDGTTTTCTSMCFSLPNKSPNLLIFIIIIIVKQHYYQDNFVFRKLNGYF